MLGAPGASPHPLHNCFQSPRHSASPLKPKPIRLEKATLELCALTPQRSSFTPQKDSVFKKIPLRREPTPEPSEISDVSLR